MLDLSETYLARETEARASANAQVLQNVREKHLLAAAAWGALAHSARALERTRAKRLADRSLSHGATPTTNKQRPWQRPA